MLRRNPALPLLVLVTTMGAVEGSFVLEQERKPDADREAEAWTAADNDALRNELSRELDQLNRRIEDDEKNVALYSRRGDVRFFLGEFCEAVADYETMVELDPGRAKSHWRRGIAYFYAGRYRDAARQFEIYHTFDDVDRENGIWRFLSQAKAYGVETARKGLLRYRKDDREPFPDVYRLFAGKVSAGEIIERIEAAAISAGERQKRLFYAHLYIGLYEFIEGREKTALEHLRRAAGNRWPGQAGFGPRWMWHVGRLHYGLLKRKLSKGDQGAKGQGAKGE